MSPEKSQKVLQDIVKTMFADKFIEEVFKPNQMYTLIETRQIFVRLAHSSIMRLNESSMQKLFDLMLMGFKLQTIQACYPEEIFHVTIKHLEVMQAMIENGSDANKLISKVKTQFMVLASNFSHDDHRVVKQQIYKFYQDKHIKVSLFIQDKVQSLDGTIYL